MLVDKIPANRDVILLLGSFVADSDQMQYFGLCVRKDIKSSLRKILAAALLIDSYCALSFVMHEAMLNLQRLNSFIK